MKPTDKITVVRPDAETITKQRLPNFVGISQQTAGSNGLSMNVVIVPPGGEAEPHYHRGFETAIYVLEGHAETRYGPHLEQIVSHQPGDFIFIPADLPHQVRNLSDTEPVKAIVARNDPNEQESVVVYDPDADAQ